MIPHPFGWVDFLRYEERGMQLVIELFPFSFGGRSEEIKEGCWDPDSEETRRKVMRYQTERRARKAGGGDGGVRWRRKRRIWW